MINAPFIKHSGDHYGDEDGTVVHLVTDTIHGKQRIIWEVAEHGKHKDEKIYIRHYAPDGEITHYVQLHRMEELIEYRDFCKSSGVPFSEIKNLSYIKKAIAAYRRIKA